MYFENKDVGYENTEFYYPIDFQINKLKEEKKELEEYLRHLLFIAKFLMYILENNYYWSSKRKTFTLEPQEEDGCKKYYLIEALNILINDTPSSQSRIFSFEEIKNYYDKIQNEINIAEGRIDHILSQLRKYDKDKII
jgi:hypothetical protein